MTQEKHYGTIIHWFDDMERGSIMSDHLEQRIFADGLSLSTDYLTPHTGDRVCFNIDHSQGQPYAQNVKLASQNHPTGHQATVTLSEWDLMQNAGFGIQADQPGQPIFILGQFLTDQSRVPEEGDLFQGTLFQHENGQWMMSDVSLLQAARADDPFQAPSHKASTPAQQSHFEDCIYKLYKAPEPKTLVMLPTDQLLSGTITSWDDAKGYGFIRFGDKSQNVFFHISAFHYATSRPKVGQLVSFYCKKTLESERQKAAKVVLRGDEVFLLDDFPSDYNQARLSTANMPHLLINSLIASAFAIFVGIHSKILLGIYCLLSIIAYFMYKFDKQIAQTRKKKSNEYQGRIPEKNLHLVDILGGWPGALISRAAYRHKTSKIVFIRIFWFTVIANLAITYALLIHYADNPLLSMLRN